METQSSASIRREVFGKLRRRARRRRGLALRMAPMIDMIFLLLLFFLVTAKWRPQEDFLPFRLPTAQAEDAAVVRPEPLEVHISATPDGCRLKIGRAEAVRIEERTIEQGLAAVMEKMDGCLRAEKRFASDPVEIICAPEVRWEHLARIYNLFYGAGLTDIAFRMTE